MVWHPYIEDVDSGIEQDQFEQMLHEWRDDLEQDVEFDGTILASDIEITQGLTSQCGMYQEEGYVTQQIWLITSNTHMNKDDHDAVSYTHLTLPTKRIV